MTMSESVLGQEPTNSNIIDIVERINQELYELMDNAPSIHGYDDEFAEQYQLTVDSNGFCTNVSLLGYPLWSTEVDCGREFNEETNEYEPFEPFLRRRIHDFLANAARLYAIFPE